MLKEKATLTATMLIQLMTRPAKPPVSLAIAVSGMARANDVIARASAPPWCAGSLVVTAGGNADGGDPGVGMTAGTWAAPGSEGGCVHSSSFVGS